MSKLSAVLVCAAVTSSFGCGVVYEPPYCPLPDEGAFPLDPGLLEAPIGELWWVPARAERWLLDEDLVVEEVLRTPTITALRVPDVRTAGPHRLVGDDSLAFEVDADAVVVRGGVDVGGENDPLQLPEHGFESASVCAPEPRPFIFEASPALRAAAANDLVAVDVWSADNGSIDDLAPRLFDTVRVRLDGATSATIAADFVELDIPEAAGVRIRLRSLVDGRTGNMLVIERF